MGEDDTKPGHQAAGRGGQEPPAPKGDPPGDHGIDRSASGGDPRAAHADPASDPGGKPPERPGFASPVGSSSGESASGGAWPDTGAAASPFEAGSDFQDSLLRELAQGPAPLIEGPAPGDRLGGVDGQRFRILSKLGEGGMGTVFRAYDEELERTVALKFLLPGAELNQTPPLSFLRREARALASLNHENIVRIFDVDEWWAPVGIAVPFLIMECLEGQSLSRLLARGRPEVLRALDLVAQVAAGLAHAHASGVVHRDIKPSNVFVLGSGRVKLLDFGLALRASSSTSPRALLRAGTPRYMAPEQHRGERPDERADIWAVGVLLFEILTGEHPYPGLSGQELSERVTSPDPVPSVRERRPELPEEVDRLVTATLAKEPDKRIHTARELRDRLRDLEARLARRRARPAAPPSELRQVTLVACWLAGLTGLTEQLDPEDFLELENAFHRACARVLHGRGGSIISAVGDEVLACFGYPQAHEDDSREAVRAALDLLPEVRRELSRTHPGQLAVKVGIHTDRVVVSAPAQPGGAPSLQGEAPKLALWLARQAEPDAVVLGETTRTLVEGVFKTRPLAPRVFEGLSGPTPTPVHRLVRARRVRSRFVRARAGGGLTPLVDRERELALLLGLWEDARQGRSSYLLLSGEAGVGKSRLVQELQRRIPPESVNWVMGQCWSDFTNSAFYPVINLLQRTYRIAPDAPPQQKRERLLDRARARGLNPEETQLLAALLVPDAISPLALSPERQREKTLELLMTLVRNASRELPLVLVYEDIHWADHSTLQMLDYMLDRPEGTRVLVLLTTRPELHFSWRPRPWLHSLQLDRLSASNTEALIRQVAGAQILGPQAVRQLVSRTDGVPLFVEELTRVVLAQVGDSSPAPRAGAIPATLHDLLLARLDLLPPWLKALAQLAAVAGRSFPIALISACTGRSEADLREDFAELIDAGLLQQDDVPEPSLAFRHTLLQEAAYQSLPRRTRRQHHARMAEALRERFPKTMQEQPELLARHFTESGQLEEAIRFWSRASELASRRSAYVEAEVHLRQALRLLRALPDAEQRGADELPLRLALGVVQVETQGFNSLTAARNYARARELLLALEDALPQIELSYWGVFAFHFARAEFQLAQDVAAQLVRIGRRFEEPYLLAVGHRMVATVLFTWGDMTGAAEEVEHALLHSEFDLERHREIARQQVLSAKHWADPTVMATAYAAVVDSAVGRPAEAWRRSREAVRMAEQLGHVNSTGYALTYSALACQLRREAECCLSWADQAIALGREHRLMLWEVWPLFFRTWALAELGRPEEALRVMRPAITRWGESGFKAGMPHNLGMLADIHLKLRQDREGLDTVAEALGWVDRTGERSYEVELWRLQGELLRLRGDEAGALKAFLRSLDVAARQGARGFGLRAAVSLARQRRELGDEGGARRVLEQALEGMDPREESPDLNEARALRQALEQPSAAPPG